MKATDLPRMPAFRNNGAVYQCCVCCKSWINTDASPYAYIIDNETLQEDFIHLHGCVHTHHFHHDFTIIETHHTAPLHRGNHERKQRVLEM